MRKKILLSTKILFVSGIFLLIFFVLPQFVHGSSFLPGANSDVGVYIDDVMGMYTNDTADANDADSGGDVSWVTGNPETRTSYIGHQTLKFSSVYVDVFSITNDLGQDLNMEYWNGSSWSDLTLLAQTHPFDSTGVNSFSFTPPSDWETTSVNGISAYYIRTKKSWAGHGFLDTVLSQISLVTVAVPTTHYAPHIITYQGKLMENSMSVTTTKAFGFLLYDSLTGGDLLYTASGTLSSTSTVNITPNQGIFSVDLGTDLTNDLSSAVFQNNSNLYLEVWVNGNKLTPRKQLVAAPFAMNSQLLLGLTATTTSSSLYIPHSDVNGNFVFTGTPQSSGVGGGVLYINPGSANTDKTLFGIAVAGAEKFRVDADGDVWMNGSLFVTSTLSVLGVTSLSTTTLSGDLTVNGSNVWLNSATTVSGTLNVTDSANFTTSTFSGDLTVGSTGEVALYVDRINSRVGIASSSPAFPLSVVGQSYFSATSTIQDINVLDGIVLGGVKRTSWSVGGGGDVVLAADNAFTGLNTFAATTTLSTTTINNLLNVGNGTLYADSLTGRVGINSSTPGFGLSVNGTSYFSGDSTFTGSTSLATTSISGVLNVDSGTLYTDVINNRVGINSTSPAFALSVSGTSFFSGSSVHFGPTTIFGKTQSPELLGTYFLPSNANDVVVRGKYAYVLSDSNSSLDIVDVSDPTTPTLISRVSDGDGGAELGGASSIYISGNLAYITAYTGHAIEVINISDPQAPFHVSKIVNGTTLLKGPKDVIGFGKYAYVLSASVATGAIEVFDLSNPLSPQLVTTTEYSSSLNGLNSGTISGNHLYVVSSGVNQMRVFDISDPVSPRSVGTLTNGVGGANLNGPTSVKVSGRNAYITGWTGNTLEIADISNPKSPAHVSTVTDGTNGARLEGATDIFIAGKYAYVTAQSENALEIIDISRPSSPRHVTAFTSTGLLTSPSGLYVANNVAYVAAYLDSTLVTIDVKGAEIDNAVIDNATIGSVNISDDIDIQGRGTIRNGLNISNGGVNIGGDFTLRAASSTIDATSTLSFSNTARFLSAATSTRSNLFIFDSANNYSNSASSTYLMSVRNNGLKAFSISSNGDVTASGTLYANSATIGTAGSPGDLAERVDIAGDDFVEPGDVVVVDPNNSDSYRRSSGPYEQAVAGVISTNPSLVIGFGKTKSTAVLAMVGRVPIKVSTENGPIHRGDVLVTASSTGYAMKYDSSKDDGTKVIGIIGVALESLESGSGKVMGLIRTGFVNNRHQTIADIQQELLKLSEVQGAAASAPEALTVGEQNGQLTFLSNDLDARGKTIFNVGRLVGKDDSWEVDNEGRFITRLATSGGKKSLYSLQSGETEYMFSGSSHLQDGVARIDFDDVTKEIIDAEKPMKINITLTSEARGVYVGTKDGTGFVVNELQGGTSNATFDYVVIATRKGKVAQEAASQNGVVAPVQNAPVAAPSEPAVVPASEPVPEVAPAPVVVVPAEPGAPAAPVEAPPAIEPAAFEVPAPAPTE